MPRHSRLQFLLAFVLLASSTAHPADETAPMTLLRITPAGIDVPAGREITFHFSAPVVPAGRMERAPEEIPFNITPAPACQWRWLNTGTLSCQLGEKEAMKPATRYSIKLTTDAEGTDARTLLRASESFFKSQPYSIFEFSTERPVVTSRDFEEWITEKKPLINLVFNIPVTATSAAETISFTAAGGYSSPAEVIDISTRNIADPGKEGIAFMLAPKKDLPEDTAVELVIRPGLSSSAGPLPGFQDVTLVSFRTFPKPRFLGVRCCRPGEVKSCHGEKRLIQPSDTRGSDDSCEPQNWIKLVFSAPVGRCGLADALRASPPLKMPKDGGEDYDCDVQWMRRREYRKGQEFDVYLPYGLKAESVYSLSASADKARDIFNRPLAEDLKVTFSVGPRSPRVVLDHEFSILEKSEETHLPVAVQHVDSLDLKYSILTPSQVQKDLQRRIPVDNPPNLSYYFPLKIRDLLEGKPGILVGSLSSTPKAAFGRVPKYFLSEVTPFHVHLKKGHFNTLVWVTDLATGKAVEGANVSIVKETMHEVSADSAVLSSGRTDRDGIAYLKGDAELDPGLEVEQYWSPEISAQKPVFKAFVRRGDDIAMVPAITEIKKYPFGVNDTYISSERRLEHGHLRAWGTTPQGIYRLGQTIQYKLYVRDQDVRSFVPAPARGYSLRVIDPLDKVVHEITDASLSRFGALQGEFTVPKNGAVGWYRFMLSSDLVREKSWDSKKSPPRRKLEALRVLVSDFTPATFKVTTDLNGTIFKPGDKVQVITQAKLHSGGPYTRAGARITATVIPGLFDFVEERARNFKFSSDIDESNSWNEGQVIHQAEAELDGAGKLETRFDVPSTAFKAGKLSVESAVQDDRGKSIAGGTTVDYRGRDRYVGLRFEDWVYPKGKPAAVKVVVINDFGKLTEGVPVKVVIEREELVASRVKGAGNAYEKHFERSWKTIQECDLTSLDSGAVACGFTPEKAGHYRATGSIKDTKNQEVAAQRGTWVSGNDPVLWSSGAGSQSVDIIGDREEYKVGEKARFLVKNPFPGAEALVTVERYGILKSWSETFSTATHILEIPIEKDYIPGFYLSVVITSPRVKQPMGEGQVDLGKPETRMGYREVTVKDVAKELEITVKPADETYKPGDKVTVDLQAKTRQKDTPPLEFAVAVLDESVFDLIQSGRDYFDPCKGFYKLDPLDLDNYNILASLIGRRKYEKKGANSGGDGGFAFRSLFKYVSYWNPSVIPDSRGRARIEFDAPDNLTGWRVLALAVTESDRMGLGQGTFRVNKPTEIQQALPNQVREGDSFEAAFTVMNRTDRSRKISLHMSAAGPIEPVQPKTVSFDVKPFERAAARLPVKALRDGEITFSASAGDAFDSDAARFTMPVLKNIALETSAAYGSSIENEIKNKFLFPRDMRPDAGAVKLILSPSIISSVDGAFRYMRDYPYTCWEQKLSKGVMAAHYAALKEYLSTDVAWNDAGKITAATLEEAQYHQAPNGGMTYYVARNEYTDPYLSSYTALAFAWLKERGHSIPEGVQYKLHEYLREILKKDELPSFYSAGMTSTTRAVALAALASSKGITLDELQRHEPHVKAMSLFGKAHFLMAALKVPEGAAQVAPAVLTDILAHSNETGGKIMFNESIDTVDFERILTTPLRDNCAVLSALTAARETPGLPAPVIQSLEHMPAGLVRSISQTRKNRDHWENTQENMFCMNSIVDYSRVFEAEVPKGAWKALFSRGQEAAQPLGEASFSSVKDAPVELTRPVQNGDPGSQALMSIFRNGAGRIYYSAQLQYSPLKPRTEPVNAGVELRREYSVRRNGRWQIIHSPLKVSQGELVRVDLYVSIPSRRNFLVVDDPVPGALETVNTDLATASKVDAATGITLSEGAYWYRRLDWIDYASTRWSFYHRELRNDSARFYSDYLAPGNYHLAYTAQAIAAGEFTAAPSHAEELYDPDVFGKSAAAVIEVERLKN